MQLLKELSYPLFFVALTIPDIAGAVDSPGAVSQARYSNWINKFFIPKFPSYQSHDIDGFMLYALRCKLLHQGHTDPSKAVAAKKSSSKTTKRLLAFTFDSSFQIHLGSHFLADGTSYTTLYAEEFCQEICEVAREWVSIRLADPVAKQKIEELVDVRVVEMFPGLNMPALCALV